MFRLLLGCFILLAVGAVCITVWANIIMWLLGSDDKQLLELIAYISLIIYVALLARYVK